MRVAKCNTQCSSSVPSADMTSSSLETVFSTTTSVLLMERWGKWENIMESKRKILTLLSWSVKELSEAKTVEAE